MTRPLPQTQASASYYAKYGYMRRMDARSDLGLVFGNGSGAHSKPLVSRERRELLTDVFSIDPRVMLFQREFTKQLGEQLTPELDSNGMCLNGVHAPWDRMKCVAGWMSTPMSYTPLDNAFYRKELKLTAGYDGVERRIANEFWDIIFSRYKLAHVKVPHKSTSGPRRNTSDATWKRDFALFLYEAPRFEAMLKCVEKDDWQTLANELEMAFMMYIQKRDQIDSVGKERWVFDLMYALTNGEQGEMVLADKSVTIDGRAWEDFSCTRARVIHAGPWVINCVLQIISSGHMQSMFELYPRVFHTSTPDQITAQINGCYFECGDVKEYDRSMSRDAIDVVHDSAERFWDARLVKMSRLLYYSPYYARPLDLNGREGTFVGDFRLMKSQVVCGNRSGHAWTSLVAKGNKCVDTLIVFYRMGLPVLGKVLTYLKSEGAINFINNGDDEIVYTADKGLLDRYKSLRYSGTVGHYHVDSEKGQGFSGLLLMFDDAEKLTYKPTPKVHTAFEKIYTPERSIGGNFRPYWPIGILERINNQDANPAGPLAWEIHNKLFHDMLAPHFGSFLSIVGNAMEKVKLQFTDALTAADRDVLENEDRIHYKYLESDISPDIYKKITSKIDGVIYKHIPKTYYGGQFHEVF